MTTVTLDAETAAFLVARALNELHANDQDEGCCPRCCGACKALLSLQFAGQLDDVVRPVADGYEWWDEQAGRVDRTWLGHAMRMTACHQDAPDD